MAFDRNDRSDVTLGELFRMLAAHGETLDEIRADVKRQNGRVGVVERHIAVLQDRGSRDDPARWGAVGAFIAGAIGTAAHFLFGK